MKSTLKRSAWDPYLVFPVAGALLLGLVGFIPALLFLGPLGQGNTGQLGFLLGCLVGMVAAIRGLTVKSFLVTLLASGVVWMAILRFWKQNYLPW